MSVINLTTTVKNVMLNSLLEAIDAGGSNAQIKFYTGPMPANPLTVITTQTLLGTATLSYPCGTISGGALTLGEITDDSSTDATGVAAFVRLETSAGVPVIDLNVSNVGGTGAVQMNTVNVVAGGPLHVSGASISL